MPEITKEQMVEAGVIVAEVMQTFTLGFFHGEAVVGPETQAFETTDDFKVFYDRLLDSSSRNIASPDNALSLDEWRSNMGFRANVLKSAYWHGRLARQLASFEGRLACTGAIALETLEMVQKRCPRVLGGADVCM